jgi:hypothetical protein
MAATEPNTRPLVPMAAVKTVFFMRGGYDAIVGFGENTWTLKILSIVSYIAALIWPNFAEEMMLKHGGISHNEIVAWIVVTGSPCPRLRPESGSTPC